MNQATADELVGVLTALASAQNLRERAFEGCEKWLRQCDGPGDFEGWAAEDIEAHFASCSLVFAHERLKYPFVDTRLQLRARDRNGLYPIPIGYYRLITLLDGTVDDDYFVIDVPRPTGG